MASLVVAVGPILAGAGQIAAFIICLFIFVFVLIILVFNLVMAFGIAWMRDKVEFLKALRPYVEDINKETSVAASTGTVPADSANPITRAAATIPVQVDNLDKKVEHATDRVANVVIEFRARTTQAKAIAQAFIKPRAHGAVRSVDQEGQVEYRSQEEVTATAESSLAPTLSQQQTMRTRR
jgi:hypothetical protein